jgi:hypothetical protein
MRSIGLDVHRQFAEVAVAQGGQAVPSGHRFEASPAGLLAFARSLGKEDQVVLEATVNTWAIVDILAAHADESSSRIRFARAPSRPPR